MDLSIQHSTCLMLLALRVQNMQLTIGITFCHNADYAAGTDIEGKDVIFAFFVYNRLFRARCTFFPWLFACFGGSCFFAAAVI